jgi:hypothetical protein
VLARLRKLPDDNPVLLAERDAIVSSFEAQRGEAPFSYRELFQNGKTQTFRRVALGFFVQSAQQLSGINMQVPLPLCSLDAPPLNFCLLGSRLMPIRSSRARSTSRRVHHISLPPAVSAELASLGLFGSWLIGKHRRDGIRNLLLALSLVD